MASSNETVYEELIRGMAKLTMSTGTLNDIQINNMHKFPLVFFNGVSKVEMDYDLEVGKAQVNYELEEKDANIKYDIKTPQNTTRITYRLTVDESQDQSNMDKRIDALKKSLANLFWTGITIQVFFNGKLIHEGKNG